MATDLDERYLRPLQKADDVVDGVLTREKYDDLGWIPCSDTIVRNCGGWDVAKRAAGVDVYVPEGAPKEYTDEEMIDALRTVDERIDGPLTLQAYEAHRDDSYPTKTAIKHRFGSWNAAKVAAGLEVRGPGSVREYTDDELLDALRAVDDRADGLLTSAAYEYHRRDDEPHVQTIYQRFDGFVAARERALDGVE